MKLPFALGALLLVAMQARAQTVGEQRCLSTCLDSTVYKPGRWGVDFLAAQDVPTLGVFRLVSNRTAWIADLSGSVHRTPADNPISPGELPPELHVTVLDAAVGLRRYRAIATQSVALFGLGASADWSRLKVDGIDETLSTFVAGPYVEAGAQYHLLPHVALGFQVRLRAVFGSQKIGQIISNDGQVVTASKPESTVELTPARLTLSLFF